MKYIDVIMFILCFNVAILFMAETGIFNALGGIYIMTADMKFLKLYNATASTESLEWPNPNIFDYMLALGVGIWTAFTLIFKLFFQVTLLAPTLIAIGVDPTISWILSTPIYMIYMWGLIQFLSGRSGRNME